MVLGGKRSKDHKTILIVNSNFDGSIKLTDGICYQEISNPHCSKNLENLPVTYTSSITWW